MYVLSGMLDELQKQDPLTDAGVTGADQWNERLVRQPDWPPAHQAEGCDGRRSGLQQKLPLERPGKLSWSGVTGLVR